MNVSNVELDALKKDPRALKSFMHYAIASQAYDVPLFYFAVHAYKKSPSKTKVIALYNIFLKDGAPVEQNINKVSIKSVEDQLTDIIVKRHQARQMNVVSRVFSSSNRVPPPTLFDQALSEALSGHNGGVGVVLSDYDAHTSSLRNSHSGSGLIVSSLTIPTSIQVIFNGVKKALTDAGFSLSELGLS